MSPLLYSGPPYQIGKNEQFTSVKLYDDLNAGHLKDFTEAFKPYVTENVMDVIVNCEHLNSFDPSWTRGLLKLQTDLKAFGKGLVFIQMQSAIKRSFQDDGVLQSFRIYPTIREALDGLGIVKKKSLNVDFINPFIIATLQVIKVQCQTEAKPQKLYLKDSKQKGLMGDVSGVIGIVSDTFQGTVVITFPEQTFLSIMSKMLGEELTELSKEVADGAGELTNIIFGQAKVQLNEKGYGIKTAIPSVVSGKNHSVQSLSKGPVVVVPFESQAGSFFIEIGLTD